MAVIKNQKTGMWEVRTYYKDWTGTRRQKTKRGFAKKSDALEWERAFKLKDELNINMKFADFVELYLSDIQPRIKYNSYLTKKHIIETKILPYFGHRKLNEIRPADVIQWQNEIMKLKKDNGEAYSPTYLKTIHNQLSAILNHAVNMYDLKDNVARKAGSMGKEESKEIMFWTQEEYQAFIEQVADKPISYYAFEILYWTGIREGELLALTPNDFDFTKKTLRINKSYQVKELEQELEDIGVVIELKEEREAQLNDEIHKQQMCLKTEREEAEKTLAIVTSLKDRIMEEGVAQEKYNKALAADGQELEDIIADKKKQLADVQVALNKARAVFENANEKLAQAEEELSEVKKLRDDLIKQGEGDYYLKEEVIQLRYENQNLKKENKGLQEKLDKAYEFMKKFVIEGKSMLDKFLEWIGEKVREGRGR